MNDEVTITFRGQRQDEEVIQLIHQHPWAMFRPGLFASLGVAFIVIMFVYFSISQPSTWTLFILGPIIALYFGYHWFLWWNNLYIVTNQRVIVIAQRSIWSRRIEDYSLEKIQSVASDTSGAAGTILNFGIVSLAIMGIKEPIVLSYIEDPRAVQEAILDATKEAESSGVKINQYDDERPRKMHRLIQH